MFNAGTTMSWASLSVSALYIILTCALAHIGRCLVDRFVLQPFVKNLFQEAIAAAELCASCFELIIGKSLNYKREYFKKTISTTCVSRKSDSFQNTCYLLAR